jgi:predicted O-linked N-acetylglucosamine transferase (SPINDLY family)
LFTALQICDWQDFDEGIKRLHAGVDAGGRPITPAKLLVFPSSPIQQQKIAALHFPAVRPDDKPAFARAARKHIRVAYLSADFHKHAIGYLTADLFRNHDRARFEVFGILLAARPADHVQEQIKHGVDHFIDLSSASDEHLVRTCRELEIDIAVDLMGFTKDCRPHIFATRVAPIQINYLGYPGTMGTPAMDYIIADHVLITPETRAAYSENVVYMPHTYQVNSRRPDSSRTFSRQELGLPETGFVFCCFNNTHKITPDVFDVWMRLLRRVDGSILWLLKGTGAAIDNLRSEAEKRGVAGGRLVFAGVMDLADHLARYRMADLFVDTFHYGAHTTASDAVWAGLPVLTKAGATFASRVAASILTTAGMADLVTRSADAYEQLAITLATSPDKLADLKQTLVRNRTNAALFDTRRFAANLEQAYLSMWKRHEARLPPADLAVTDTGS